MKKSRSRRQSGDKRRKAASREGKALRFYVTEALKRLVRPTRGDAGKIARVEVNDGKSRKHA